LRTVLGRWLTARASEAGWVDRQLVTSAATEK
jgi:hypothetical protein